MGQQICARACVELVILCTADQTVTAGIAIVRTKTVARIEDVRARMAILDPRQGPQGGVEADGMTDAIDLQADCARRPS